METSISIRGDFANCLCILLHKHLFTGYQASHTSIKVDIRKVDVPSIGDDYILRKNESKKFKGEDEFLKGDSLKAAIVSDKSKTDQQKIDDVSLKIIAATPMLKGYLASLFALKRGDKPHAIKF